MELCDWEECSVELASFLVDRAPADLFSHRATCEEKLEALRHLARFSWNEKVMRAVGSRKPPAISQRSVINPRAKEHAKALKVRFYRIWFAPPELSVETARK